MPRKERKSKAQVKLKPAKVAALVDKNSRTILKIIQLIEINQRKGSKDIDKDGVISRRIEMLKMRLNRRLLKLSKWADTPEEERNPIPVVTLEKQTLVRSSNGKFASSASVSRGQSFVSYTHMAPVAQNQNQHITKPNVNQSAALSQQNSFPSSNLLSSQADKNSHLPKLVQPIIQQPQPPFPTQRPFPPNNHDAQFAAVLELQRQLSQDAAFMMRPQHQPTPRPQQQQQQQQQQQPMEVHSSVAYPYAYQNVVRNPMVLYPAGPSMAGGPNPNYIPTVSSRTPNIGYQYALDPSMPPAPHANVHPSMQQSTTVPSASSNMTSTQPSTDSMGQAEVGGTGNGEIANVVQGGTQELSQSQQENHGATSGD